MSQTLDALFTDQEGEDGPRAGGGPDGPEQRGRERRPHRRRRIVAVVLVALLVLLAVPAVGAVYVGHRLTSHITRVAGVFDDLPNRPHKPTTGAAAKAENILLLGTDRRSDVATTGDSAKASDWVPGEQRSDTMMVLHIDADRRGASVISIPRDSWVNIPGHGTAKVNAAFSWGGPRLAVETVEQLTDVRIDHVAIVDWDGYKSMINTLGGIDVTIPKTVYDSARKHTWTAGTHHLDGAQALLYARERHGLPGGDLDRVKRQQEVLRELSKNALAATSSPTKLYGLLDALSRHLTVDSGWSSKDLATLAFSMRSLHSGNVKYLTIPVTGTGMVGDQSVVFVDRSSGSTLWKAVHADTMDEWTAKHAELLTGATIN